VDHDCSRQVIALIASRELVPSDSPSKHLFQYPAPSAANVARANDEPKAWKISRQGRARVIRARQIGKQIEKRSAAPSGHEFVPA
jgi:hypothetical protein